MLSSTTFSAVIDASKQSFIQQGVPQIIYADNGHPFFSKVFWDFTKDWEVTLQTSSPYHPQSNGLAESLVKTIKSLLCKSHILITVFTKP